LSAGVCCAPLTGVWAQAAGPGWSRLAVGCLAASDDTQKASAKVVPKFK